VYAKAWVVAPAPASIKVLFATSIVLNVGFYIMIPYLSLYVTGQLHWSVMLAGALLGVRQFARQGFSFIGGMAADRYGCKLTLIVGIAGRGIGFIAFAACHSIWSFFLDAALSGLGGALFEPAYQAAYVKLSPAEHRKLLFALKNIIH